MKHFIFIFSLCLAYSTAYTQVIDFTLADPQPDLVEIYSGSSDSGDIDGDGDNDLIMTGITPASKTILYLNDGDGIFTEIEGMPLPQAGNGKVIFADLDGDDDLDLFFSGTANTIQEFTHIYLNDGAGGFTQLANPALPRFSDSGVDVADVDSDGDIDLLITVKAANGDFIADVFLNNGNAIFTPAGELAFDGLQFGQVAFIDVENDGDLDVIISGEQADESALTRLYLNDGTGNYVIDINSDFEQMVAADIDVADLDNDGNLDILMSGNSTANGVQTILYHNDGFGQFEELPATNLQNTFAGTNAIADMDNDGDQDIVIIGSQDGGLPNIYNIVYENRSNNVFVPVDTLGGEYIAACVVDDFNGDNLVDIIIQGFADRTNVYWNTSSITTALDELEKIPLIDMFPNPSSGTLNLYLAEIIEDLDLMVYSTTGQLILQQPFVAGIRSELQLNLQAGAYVVLLKSGNSIVSRDLLIME